MAVVWVFGDPCAVVGFDLFDDREQVRWVAVFEALGLFGLAGLGPEVNER